MKKCLALLLVLVMLLSACGTAQPSNTDPSEETKNTVLDHQNGTTETTASGETSNTETTGDNSGTGTVPPTTEPTVEPTTIPTTEPPTEQTTPPTESTPPSTEALPEPPTENTVPEDYTLKISQSSLSLEVGQIGNLTVEYTGTGTIVWKTSDSSIATVSNGKVTAKAAGTVVITVTDGVKSSQCKVTITKKETPVEVTLKLSKSSLDLKVGESSTLSVTYTGSKSLSWTSTNSAVATVSNGKITAKAAGTAYISVSDGVKTATCLVTVTNPAPPVEVKLTVSPTTLNLVVGNTSTLTASYNGTGTLSWSSDKPSVVTVSNGKVTAKAAGTATITVTDGNKSATCNVTVTAPVTAPAYIEFYSDFMILGMYEAERMDVYYTGNKKLSYSSSDTSVATIDDSGMPTPKSVGETIITVTDGVVSDEYLLVIEHDLEINYDNIPTTLAVGETFQIDYRYSGDKSDLTWEAQHTSIITVDENGVVTAVGDGRSDVFVSYTDAYGDSVVHSIDFEVDDGSPAVTTIEFYKSNQNAPLYEGVTKYAGDYMELWVSCVGRYDEDGKWWTADNWLVSVYTSDRTVVSVSVERSSYSMENYVTLNFKSAGTATITIASADGAYSESYTINVKGDYDCNPGSGQLTPEQFVNAYNGVVSANGMDTTCVTGYLVLTLSDSELTWAIARREAEGGVHAWYSVGKSYLCLTYEGTNDDGKHIFYVHR